MSDTPTPAQAAEKAIREARPVQWKFGDEFAPYHPQASHCNPDYRDGWNHCYRNAEAQLAEMRAEVERLRADARNWDIYDNREFRAIGAAVNRAALELPEGARIRIYLEKDSGTVYWINSNKGVWRHVEGSGELFSEQINSAIAALAADGKDGAR